MEQARRLAGRYLLLEPIGRGGMGMVWRAHDELLDRAVAVKEVLYSALDDNDRAAFNRRTIREARAAGRLSHPNVVVVHDVIEEGGRPWIVMQLVRSRSLGQVIREHGPLIPERTAIIALQVLDALCTAHDAGILHRDVKPENVLLTGDSRVVLTDFGIATMPEEPSLTMSGGITGTPAFMPPERLMGHPATPESDLWSLGATIYAAVEGHAPYDRGTPIASMAAVLHSHPAPPRRAGPLTPVIEGLLRKDPGLRLDAVEAEKLLKHAATGDGPPQLLSVPQPPGEGRDGPASPRVVPPWIPSPDPITPPVRWRPADFGIQPNGDQRALAQLTPAQLTPAQLTPAQLTPGQFTPGELTPGAPWAPQPGGDLPAPGAHQEGPPEPGEPDAPPARRNLISIVLVFALVVAAGVGGWFGYQALMGAAGSNFAAPATPTEAGEPTEGVAGTASPSPGTPSRALPPGWLMHRDELGFTIALPPGWAAQDREAGRVRFRGPGIEGYLQVDLTPWGTTDPLEALKTVEKNSTAKGYLPKYRRIGMEATDFRGEPAADWEFTFVVSAGKQRVIDRAFRIGDVSYALYWQVPEASWGSGLTYFDTFTTSFQPT